MAGNPQDMRAGRVRSLLKQLRPGPSITIGILGHPVDPAQGGDDAEDDQLFPPSPEAGDGEDAAEEDDEDANTKKKTKMKGRGK